MAELLRRISGELNALRTAIEEITGLTSRWSGNLILIESQDLQILKGKALLAEKQWNCDITVNAAIAEEPVRWRTWIHEMLHSVSVGMNAADYRRFRGWEEAVIEQLQRLLRQQILKSIGVHIEESVFTQVESFWVFNPYIEAIETLRVYLKQTELSFYMGLLKTPLADRIGYMYELNSTVEYRRLLAVASGKLR